jgi:hypothetical protein
VRLHPPGRTDPMEPPVTAPAPPPAEPTAADLELLRAIDTGHVADRRHLRSGWSTRRADTRAGVGMGRNVTARAQRLRDMGLAEPASPGFDRSMADRPWRLTVNGRLELARNAAQNCQTRGDR